MTADDAVRYVFDSCRLFGASLVTAHRVAALVAEECERIEAAKANPAVVAAITAAHKRSHA